MFEIALGSQLGLTDTHMASMCSGTSIFILFAGMFSLMRIDTPPEDLKVFFLIEWKLT